MDSPEPGTIETLRRQQMMGDNARINMNSNGDTSTQRTYINTALRCWIPIRAGMCQPKIPALFRSPALPETEFSFCFFVFFAHPSYYARNFSFSFSLSSHNSDTLLTMQGLLPPPHYGTRLPFYRDKTSALSFFRRLDYYRDILKIVPVVPNDFN